MLPPLPAERWRSRMTFVFALSIATVGLGNLWRFAWLMGENGGGPFVLSYLLCLLLIGVPLLAAEILVGTHGRGSPLSSVAWAVHAAGRSRIWLLVPLLTLAAAAMMLVICVLVAGWALFYAFEQQLGTFAAMPLDEVGQFLSLQLERPRDLLLAQTAVAIAVALIGAAGVRRGLGLYAWIAVPLLIWITGACVGFALEFGDLDAAGRYLFAWQELDFSATSFLAALGHAMFTLSIGVAVGLSFGAHAPMELPILRSVIAVALFDLVVAVAVGVALYPLLFEANVVPARDFAFLFVAVPFAFGSMPFGDLYGALFFVLVVIAALGSAAALLEPLLSVLEEQFRVPRRLAVMVVGAIAWALSCVATSSLASGGGLLPVLDRSTAFALIPLAMLLLAIFAGWRLPRGLLRQELHREPDILFRLWYVSLRFLAAPVILVAWLWLVLVP